jgi:carbon storage regulator
MLLLSRKCGQEIVIDGEITVRVLQTCGGRVRIGIDAPKHVSVVRADIFPFEGETQASAPLDRRPLL